MFTYDRGFLVYPRNARARAHPDPTTLVLSYTPSCQAQKPLRACVAEQLYRRSFGKAGIPCATFGHRTSRRKIDNELQKLLAYTSAGWWALHGFDPRLCHAHPDQDRHRTACNIGDESGSVVSARALLLRVIPGTRLRKLANLGRGKLGSLTSRYIPCSRLLWPNTPQHEGRLWSLCARNHNIQRQCKLRHTSKENLTTQCTTRQSWNGTRKLTQ